MTHFEWYIFKLVKSSSSKRPNRTHNFFDDENGLLWIIGDNTDKKHVFYSSDDGANWTEITWVGAGGGIAGDFDLIACYYDRINGRIYISDTSGRTSYINISSKAITDSGSFYGNEKDFIYANSKVYTFIVQPIASPGESEAYFIEWGTGNNWHDGMGVTDGDITVSYCINIDDDVYYLWNYANKNVELWKWTPEGAFTQLHDYGANTTIPSSLSLKGLAYDGNDLLYCILEDSGDNKNYLHVYSFNSDSSTKGGEYNVALMLDRNNIGTSPSPWEFEKGFHITTSNIYQISRSYANLLKIQNLGLTGGETIIAITDKYLITSNSDLYKYTESLSDLAKAQATYKTHALPKGSLEHTTQLSTDQVIEIYENNEGTYTLAFRGKLGRPKYRVRKGKPFYLFSCKNMGFDDLKQKVSYTATAEGIDEVVIALFGQLINPYLYVDATSVPNIAINMTYTFDDEYLKDALYVCAILGNAYPWYEPNGYSYFSTWAAKLISKWYFGSPDNFNDEAVGAITSASDMDWINTLDLPNTCTASLEATLDNHKNVLKLSHDGGADDPSIIHDFPAAQATGIYEYWTGSSNNGRQWNTSLRESTISKISVYLHIDGNIHHFPNNVITDTGVAYANDILVQIKIIFDCGAGVNGEYQLYINSAQIGGNHEMRFSTTNLDNLLIKPPSNVVYSGYIDAPGNVADSHYVEGYNTRDSLTQTTSNIGPPKSIITQIQYNDFSNVRGGWNSATNKPFEPTTPTIAEHVQQYGTLLWDGRRIFAGAISQASIDAIVAGLKAWQGMISNPIDMEMFVLGKYYYPVGYYASTQYIGRTEFLTLTDRILIKNITDFKRPGKIKATFSDNLVMKH